MSKNGIYLNCREGNACSSIGSGLLGTGIPLIYNEI
jgi:hypothetical protein